MCTSDTIPMHLGSRFALRLQGICVALYSRDAQYEHPLEDGHCALFD